MILADQAKLAKAKDTQIPQNIIYRFIQKIIWKWWNSFLSSKEVDVLPIIRIDISQVVFGEAITSGVKQLRMLKDHKDGHYPD